MHPDKKHYLLNFILPMIALVSIVTWLILKR